MSPTTPVHFSAVDVADALREFSDLEKSGGVYVARLPTPLEVVTPPLTLLSPLLDEDGGEAGHALLKLSPEFEAFAEEVERRVLEACLANKDTWFRRRLDDDALRASFKQLCKGGTLKVKLRPGAAVFDACGEPVAPGDVDAGARMKCLLELTKVCFGKTEFGAMWSLAQARLAPPPASAPKCLIGDDDGAAEAPVAPDETDEFQ